MPKGLGHSIFINNQERTHNVFENSSPRVPLGMKSSGGLHPPVGAYLFVSFKKLDCFQEQEKTLRNT